jgi:TolB-like protein
VIAVLAFTDMSPARDQEYFCEGIAEEILNGLGNIEGLHVASRTSAFRYKGQAIDIGDIGRQLKVDTVLEGSVRTSGNRLRITAQLIKVADGFHLWSERYDRTIEDVFAIQDEISEAIVGALKLTLRPRAEEVPRQRARNAAAYNSYLKGRYCWDRRSRTFPWPAPSCSTNGIGVARWLISNRP